MNPVTSLVNEHIVFQLTEEDHKKMRQVSLVDGKTDIDAAISHRMCIMQLIAMLTNERSRDLKAERKNPERELGGYDDESVCVSEAIRDYLVDLNDELISTRQRNKLKSIVEDVMNTCPVVRRELNGCVLEISEDHNHHYRRAEETRREILRRRPAHSSAFTLNQKIELVKEAAAVYRVTPNGEEMQAQTKTT